MKKPEERKLLFKLLHVIQQERIGETNHLFCAKNNKIKTTQTFASMAPSTTCNMYKLNKNKKTTLLPKGALRIIKLGMRVIDYTRSVSFS